MKISIKKLVPFLAIGILLFTASCKKEIFDIQEINKEVDPPKEENANGKGG